MLAYGHVGGSSTSLFRSNLWKHALPSLLAAVILFKQGGGKKEGPSSLLHTALAIVSLDIAWLVCADGKGRRGGEKVSHLYGVSVSWVAGVAVLQAALLLLFR